MQAGAFDVGLFPLAVIKWITVPQAGRDLSLYIRALLAKPVISKLGIKEQGAPVVIPAPPCGVHLQPSLMETCLYGGGLAAPGLRAALYL